MKMSETLNVQLSPDLRIALQDAVDAGEFSSEADVIVSAVGDWHARRLLQGWSNEEIGAAFDEGIASGEPIDGVTAFDDIRMRFEALQRHKV